MPTQESAPILYTSASCGWALRNYAAFYEKGVTFEAVDVKNSGESVLAAFRREFPYGRTPGLRHGRLKVWESLVINEYIEAAFPEGPPLLPDDAGGRARARQWTHHCDAILFPALYKALHTETGNETDLLVDLDALSHASFLTKAPKPYWGGKQIGLVDFAYHLFFTSLQISAAHARLTQPALPNWMNEWAAALAEAPSIRAADAFKAKLSSSGAAA